MASTGGLQIIGGKQYTQYTPEWYTAMEAEKQKQAKSAGLAAGTEAGTAAKTGRDIVNPNAQTQQDQLYSQMLASLNGAGGTSGVGAGYTGGGSAGLPPRIGGGGGATSGGTGGGYTSGGTGGGGTGTGGGGYSTVAPVDTSAAESAAFGRAKDQVGETSQGALSGLRSALGGRGMLGSGAEYRGTANVFNKGQQQLGDVSRGLAIKGAENAQENAQTNYAGGLTQRGQNMNDAQTALSAQVAQRGQDIGAQSSANALQAQIAQANAQARQSTLNGLLSALSKGGSY